jgi:alkylation response protein AidB-like acyl-CoA dehydrogenase
MMDFRFSPEDEKYREDLRAWLEKAFPKDEPLPKLDSLEAEKKAYQKYQKKLFDGGYAGILYPKEYGGQDGTLIQQVIVNEELTPYMEVHGASINGIGMGMALPTINAAGTKEQKEMFIRKLLDGTHVWVQAFSEPNAGSDVASITTRAVKKGDHYIVNGQKVWTTYAHQADYSLLLVRTNPDKPKHKGLSYLLLDLKSPGVEIRRIKQITGEAHFNEIFLDNVKIPVNMLVGEEDEGWRIALTTLMFERAAGDLATAHRYMYRFNEMIEMARTMKKRGRPILEDPLIRQKVAECYAKLLILKYNGFRNASKMVSGGVPGPEGSISKLYHSTLWAKISELALEIQGPYHQLTKGSSQAIKDGYFQTAFLAARGSLIAAGSTEIMKNIIGERVLHLPKDIARATITKRS